jgi:hypothetical protein
MDELSCLVHDLARGEVRPSRGYARKVASAPDVCELVRRIFAKSGTASRGDLVARLFFDHYAPRLTALGGAGG